jgi:hypothetical protein
MQILRSCSTRARITSTSFTNHYEWGNFKGDVDEWMEKYFDAFLYLSNFRYREFKLRLPSAVLDLRTARRYCCGEGASVREIKGNIVFTFSVEDEDDEWDYLDTDEKWLSSFVPLRADLARGDLRALYLGWLHLVQSGSLSPGAIEPPVPAGLSRLSGSLESLAEFLFLDAGLVRAGSQLSERSARAVPKKKELRAKLAKLPVAEKDELLAGLLGANDDASVNPILREFTRKHILGKKNTDEKKKRRTVRQLLRAAKNSERSEDKIG